MVDMEETTLRLRRAVAADEERVREISAKIWEGHDYTGGAFAAWLSEKDGEVIVALRGTQIVGFAHRRMLLPDYAWFDGIRVDPAHKGGGVAKAITRHFMEAARSEGADAIGLSTYIENEASMHIVEQAGFSRVASFVLLEARPDAAARSAARGSNRCEPIPSAEAIPFVSASRFLCTARGHLPHGWTFYPFARDPHLALRQGQELIGIRDCGRLVGLAAISRSLQHDGELAIDFIEAEGEALEELARHVLSLARPGDVVQAVCPKVGDERAPALDVLAELGVPSWNALAPDVFVYERVEPR